MDIFICLSNTHSLSLSLSLSSPLLFAFALICSDALDGYDVQAAEEHLKRGSFAVSLVGKSLPLLSISMDTYDEQEDMFQALSSAGATPLDEDEAGDSTSLEASCVHDFFAANIDQDMVDFHRYAGKVLLVVNVASK
jgi:hypothetical protein